MPAGSAQGRWRTQILTPPYPVSTWQTPDSYSTLKACVLRHCSAPSKAPCCCERLTDPTPTTRNFRGAGHGLGVSFAPRMPSEGCRWEHGTCAQLAPEAPRGPAAPGPGTLDKPLSPLSHSPTKQRRAHTAESTPLTPTVKGATAPKSRGSRAQIRHELETVFPSGTPTPQRGPGPSGSRCEWGDPTGWK